MNKKSVIIAAVIVLVAIAIGTVTISKAILGDVKTKLPGEEGTENILHVQESNNTSHVQTSNNTESTESGP
ncbi:MAG TPA: hypothetical protein VEU72_01170 [Nitrosopumilaceae archaeon]|nr:hypothetical protein [Nitrosopumilaceae archaeon]